MTTKMFVQLLWAGLTAGLTLGMVGARACTSIVVSRGASTDGSVIVTYSADAPFMPRLLRSCRWNTCAGNNGRCPRLGG